MAANLREGSIENDRSGTADRPGAAIWAPLFVALVAPLLLLQIAIVRPNATQLARMRGQISRLEATIAELKEKTPAAERSANLLAELGEQESHIVAAESALDRFARLEARLTSSVERAERAADALDRLDGMICHVDEQAQLLVDAERSLQMLALVPGELHAAIDRASEVTTAVKRVDQVTKELGVAQSQVIESQRRVDDLIAMQESLALDSDKIVAAGKTLEGLLQLEQRLNYPLMAVAASHERLDALVQLKDAVIAQTDNLPAAFETFDLIVDLQSDYQRARQVFRTVQRLMADLVLLEPSISRIAAVVEPMIDQATVSGLAGHELRLVLREMRDRRATELARLQAESESESVAARDEPAVK